MTSKSLGEATTCRDAVGAATEILTCAGIAEAGGDARLLFCHITGLSAAELVLRADESLEGNVLQRYSALVVRRAKREPVSRILGRRGFWKDQFAIGPGVLDPRPETELIIETALELLADRRSQLLRILDLGAGSGALLVSLLREFPAAIGLGVEIGAAASAIALKNIEMLGVGARGAILNMDWNSFETDEKWDLIVANPPYIPSKDLAQLEPEVREWDPHQALDGGRYGLDSYLYLGAMAARILAPGGVVIFEIGYDQEHSAAEALKSAGLKIAGLRRDLAGLPRVLIGRAAIAP